MLIYSLQADNWQCIELSLKCSNVLCFIYLFLLYKLEQHLISSPFIPAAFALPITEESLISVRNCTLQKKLTNVMLSLNAEGHFAPNCWSLSLMGDICCKKSRIIELF